MVDTTKVALGAVVAGAIGLGLWCLSSDSGGASIGAAPAGKLKYRTVHTLEKLTEILDELELEFICVYTRVYNLMLKSKEAKTWEPAMLGRMRGQVHNDIAEKTDQVLAKPEYKDLGLNRQDLDEWVKHFAHVPVIRKQADNLGSLERQVFEQERVDHISF